MKWDDLRSFLAVAREGRLTAAGKALGLDTATVGRQLSRLEAALGVRLFERGAGGHALTEAGRRLLPRAEAMEAEARALSAVLAGAEQEMAGPVRIGAPDGIATFLLPALTLEISRAWPRLELQLVAMPRSFDVARREADMVLTLSPPTAGRLRVRRVADYHLHLYATREVAASAGGLTDVAALRSVRGIGYVSDLIYHPELDYVPLVGPDLAPRLTCTSLAVQLAWARMGAGVAILPDFMARSCPELLRILPLQVSFTRSYYLVSHEENRHVPRLEAVAERLASGLREALAGASRSEPLVWPAEGGVASGP
ncbi:LysR family transcriptional regulator [Oceanicella sp. SM1341]|uniref:LysR family transcriptional regulator n=1 Tax=Oceanicella sp. SM1341 TaxID=1548889 RepID=UPI000E4C2281|nr:LysR family transcriptional regulator [Oceanicella sp. SM1341]